MSAHPHPATLEALLTRPMPQAPEVFLLYTSQDLDEGPYVMTETILPIEGYTAAKACYEFAHELGMSCSLIDPAGYVLLDSETAHMTHDNRPCGTYRWTMDVYNAHGTPEFEPLAEQ